MNRTLYYYLFGKFRSRLTSAENAIAGISGGETGNITDLADRVTSAENAITGKADASDLSTLAGRVTDAETALSGKASSSDLSTLAGRVTTAEGTLSEHTTAISRKASANDLTALATRVTTAEETISDHTTAIAALATRVTNIETAIESSSTVTSLTSGYIRVAHEAAPIALKTNAGSFYPLEKGSVTSDSSYWYIDPAPYLAYDGVASFSGTWTVYFAGGLPEVMTIIAATTAITPAEHQVFQHTLAASDAITIDTSALSATKCMTFELWLDMPSTAVSFTLPSGIAWVTGSAPDFSSGSTRYVIAVRWNGTKLLANLAYTEALS